MHLIQGHRGKPLHKVLRFGSIVKVLEKSCYRNAGSPEHPCIAHDIRPVFDRRTFLPIQHDGILAYRVVSGKGRASPSQPKKGTPKKFPSSGFMVLATTYSRTT